MYVTIAPGADKDLPVFHHEYLWTVGTMNTLRSGSYGSYVRWVDWIPTQNLADTVTLSTISNNRGGVTELSFEINNLKRATGSGNNNFFILAEFINSNGWTGGSDPFATYTNTAIDDE